MATDPCHYGTTRPLDTLNPVKANLQHWAMLARDSLNTARWQDKVALWFRPTGWRPADCLAMDANDPGMQKSGCAQRPKYDPQTTAGRKLYVACSMMLTFAVCTMFIFLSPKLSSPQITAGVALVISGLVIANDLLENRSRYRWAEAVRVPLMLWFAASLWTLTITTTVVDTVTIARSAEQSLGYASSVNRWPEWHPQSTQVTVNKKGPLQTGDHFQEVIDTPLGPNRLSWEVTNSEPGHSWSARGINLDNDMEILLSYQVKDTGGYSSEFERTLQYSMPNFPMVVANALYFRRAIEKKSEAGLERLKRAIEAL